MCKHRDSIESRNHISIPDTNPLALLVKDALAAKDRRIDELLASNQALRARAQAAEEQLRGQPHAYREHAD